VLVATWIVGLVNDTSPQALNAAISAMATVTLAFLETTTFKRRSSFLSRRKP